jgi:hypothetical protein
MAKFTTYAEILTPNHVQWKAYASGIKKNRPGVVLKDILDHTGGVYENKIGLTPEIRRQLRDVAQLTGDNELMEIANASSVTVSLEHLRHVDPQTRIVCGYRLNYTAEESARLGLNHKGSFDPRETMLVNLDPANIMLVDRG